MTKKTTATTVENAEKSSSKISEILQKMHRGFRYVFLYASEHDAPLNSER